MPPTLAHARLIANNQYSPYNSNTSECLEEKSPTHSPNRQRMKAKNSNNSIGTLTTPRKRVYTVPIITPTSNYREIQTENIIIFDWDDTLFPSSFLARCGLNATHLELSDRRWDHDLEMFEKTLVTFFTSIFAYLANQVGSKKIYIVTNAEKTWVERSIEKFLPSFSPFLKEFTLISARDLHIKSFPESPFQWKRTCFKENLQSSLTNTSTVKNVLAFGDSHVEREALRDVILGVTNTKCKTIKFTDRPSIDQLQKQLELVYNCFPYIFSHNDNLDLQLTVTLHTVIPSSTTTSTGTSQHVQPIAIPPEDASASVEPNSNLPSNSNSTSARLERKTSTEVTTVPSGTPLATAYRNAHYPNTSTNTIRSRKPWRTIRIDTRPSGVKVPVVDDGIAGFSPTHKETAIC